MSVTRFEDFLSASLKRRSPGGLAALSPAETVLIEKIAGGLDDALAQMVQRLEAAARCQQENMTSVSTDAPPFTAFCIGLRQIGEALVPHLFNEYDILCQAQKIAPETASWIAAARAEAFVSYLLQLASVHGLAFEGAPKALGDHERAALDDLRRQLMSLIQMQVDSLAD